MARALGAIVPFTSLAIYEADHRARVLVPVFAVGRYVEQTLADRPPFDASIGGSVVRSREMAHIELARPAAQPVPDPRHAGRRARGDGRRAARRRRRRRSGRSACGARGSSGRGSSRAEAQLIRRFATLAALAYANAQQRELLREQALTDALTGLANRRHFHERLQAEVARGEREGRGLSLILFDVDDFKSINDGYGHPAGDAALRGFAASSATRRACRTSSAASAARSSRSCCRARRSRRRCATRSRVLLASRCGALRPDGRALTASAGVANAHADGRVGDELLRVADDRLLAAKAGGKDRVECGLAAVA